MFQILAAKTAAPALTGYIPYGVGEFDGQGSGHDQFGVRVHFFHFKLIVCE